MKLGGNIINSSHIYKNHDTIFVYRVDLSHTPQFGTKEVSCAWCTNNKCNLYKFCILGYDSTHYANLCKNWRCDYNI